MFCIKRPFVDRLAVRAALALAIPTAATAGRRLLLKAMTK